MHWCNCMCWNYWKCKPNIWAALGAKPTWKLLVRFMKRFGIAWMTIGHSAMVSCGFLCVDILCSHSIPFRLWSDSIIASIFFSIHQFQIWMHDHGISKWKNALCDRVWIVSIIVVICRHKHLWMPKMCWRIRMFRHTYWQMRIIQTSKCRRLQRIYRIKWALRLVASVRLAIATVSIQTVCISFEPKKVRFLLKLKRNFFGIWSLRLHLCLRISNIKLNLFFWFVFISPGIANNCGISQIGNTNGQSQSNEFNEPYDNNGLIDIAVGPHFMNGGQDRNAYGNGYGCWDMEKVDLSDEFKKHYEVWLQKEVFSIRIDWDSLKTVYDIEMDENTVNGKAHPNANANANTNANTTANSNENDSSVKLNATAVMQSTE